MPPRQAPNSRFSDLCGSAGEQKPAILIADSGIYCRKKSDFRCVHVYLLWAVFTVLKTEGFARRGRLDLAHGSVQTPTFMPVGTIGAVKTVAPWELEALGAQII